MTRSRRAFTIVELLVVMTVIGVLTRIAVPKYGDIRRRAVAVSILSDVRSIQLSSFAYYSDAGAFPPMASDGKVPTQLSSYLPKKFSFKKPDYSYRWYTWKSTTKVGKNKVTETLVGVRVTSQDATLIARLARMAGAGFAPVVNKSNVTFLLSTAN